MTEFAHAEVAASEHPRVDPPALIEAPVPNGGTAVADPVVRAGLVPAPVAPASHPVSALQTLRDALHAAADNLQAEIDRQAAEVAKVPTLDDVHELLNRIQAGK